MGFFGFGSSDNVPVAGGKPEHIKADAKPIGRSVKVVSNRDAHRQHKRMARPDRHAAVGLEGDPRQGPGCHRA